MTAMQWRTRPSAILQIDDLYEAWCVDEAIADYAARIRRGEKPVPFEDAQKPKNNLDLIRQIKEAQRNRGI